MNTNLKVLAGLTRLEIKPESAAPGADGLSTRPLSSERVSYLGHTFTESANSFIITKLWTAWLGTETAFAYQRSGGDSIFWGNGA